MSKSFFPENTQFVGFFRILLLLLLLLLFLSGFFGVSALQQCIRTVFIHQGLHRFCCHLNCRSHSCFLLVCSMSQMLQQVLGCNINRGQRAYHRRKRKPQILVSISGTLVFLCIPSSHSFSSKLFACSDGWLMLLLARWLSDQKLKGHCVPFSVAVLWK